MKASFSCFKSVLTTILIKTKKPQSGFFAKPNLGVWKMRDNKSIIAYFGAPDVRGPTGQPSLSWLPTPVWGSDWQTYFSSWSSWPLLEPPGWLLERAYFLFGLTCGGRLWANQQFFLVCSGGPPYIVWSWFSGFWPCSALFQDTGFLENPRGSSGSVSDSWLCLLVHPGLSSVFWPSVNLFPSHCPSLGWPSLTTCTLVLTPGVHV